MLIPVTCRCGKRFSATKEHAGKKAECPNCGQLVNVPTAARERRRRAEAAVAAPARALLGFAAALFLAGLLVIILGVIGMLEGAKDEHQVIPLKGLQPITVKGGQEGMRSGMLLAGAGALVVVYALALARGALALRQLTSYGWAVAGCALGTLTVLGAPFAAWAFLVLSRQEVRSRFGPEKGFH